VQVGTVSELWRFPVKSLGGESLATAHLTAQGVVGDRCWAFVDAASGEIRSAKQLPKLLGFRAGFATGAEPAGPVFGAAVPDVEITGPDGARYGSRDPGAPQRVSAALGAELRLVPLAPPEDRAHYRLRAPRTGEQIASDLQLQPGEAPDFSQTPAEVLVTLLEYATPPGSYVDAYPLHLLTSASLAAFAQRSGLDADARRFRPNLVIDTGDGPAEFREFDWVGSRLEIGDVVLHVESKTIRCSMPSRAQPQFGLLEVPRITPALVLHCKRHIGVNVKVERAGTVRTGDPVVLRKEKR
jgi:uncharacterized protein YcbX